MKLSEHDLQVINQYLKDHFGIDTVTGDPMWRVVWSDDQYEKRLGTYDDITPAGLYLRTVTEVRLVPKYKQWIHQKYILEHLVVIPDMNLPELPTQKVSYEPIWTFQDKNEKFLPPTLPACQFVIDTVHAAMGKSGLKKYTDDENSQEASLEAKKKRVDGLMEELYGDESGLNGAIVHGEAVGYSGPSKI